MINKFIWLSILATATTCSNGGLAAIANQPNVINNLQNNNDAINEQEACSMMYVGKNVCKDNVAIIARSADANPKGMNLNFKITEHNELANKTIEGKNGFEWTMPETTYRYISTPRNIQVNKGKHWEVSGINENGVCVTATLSCATNNAANQNDPLDPKGISEDNITQIVSAVAKTAKEGIQYIAHIIDTAGNSECNAIMVSDQNEAWYMEMYTGHQYFAMKMPDDKACTIGNEFMLESIDELNLQEGQYITSPDLFKMPKEKGFVKYETGKPQTDENIDLFDTYAEPLWKSGDSEKVRIFSDNSHRRTWRGYSLFAPNLTESQSYDSSLKYKPFFVPEQKLGVSDVITFMRDRFESLKGADGKFPSKYNKFQDDYETKNLRYVAYESAYQVHVLESDPNLPAEYACKEWICLSNSNYAPFIPISNGVDRINDYYTHVSEHYSYDEDSAVCIFKRLNALAATDREKYGLPIQQYLTDHEAIWQKQYADIINKVKDLSVGEARDIITNYCLYIQKVALIMSKGLYDDLMWHIMNTQSSMIEGNEEYKPITDIEYYAWLYGWDYQRKGETVTLSQNDEKIEIDLTYLWDKKGTIKKGDVTKDVKITIIDNVPYMDYAIAQEFISQGKEIAEIKLDEFKNKNDLVWIIPVAIGVPLVVTAGILIPTLIISNKKKKHATTK